MSFNQKLMSQNTTGFSKLSKEEKINWIAAKHFSNPKEAVALLQRYQNSDASLQKLHDEFIESNPVFMILRLVSSQFPFEPGMFSEFSRPALLFHDIPQQLKGLTDIPQFDIENKFQAITGVSVLDFITTGFVISSASHGNFAVNQNYFKKTRNQGIKIPDDQTIRAILNQLVADKTTLIKVYEKWKNKDRRFKMYDFNPLLYYPVIKPCQDKQFSIADKDFIHAPVPELVPAGRKSPTIEE